MIRWRHGWHILRDFAKRNQTNAVDAYAAEATLFVVISFFPSALLLLSSLPHLPFTQAQITNTFVQIIPAVIADFMQSILEELYPSPRVTVTVITAVLALWSSSRGSVALMRGLDRIYGIRRTRGYVVMRLLASVYVLFFFVLLTIVLAFLAFGGVVLDWLSKSVPWLATAAVFKRGGQLVVSFAVLFLVFWLLYVATTREWTRCLRQTPGALLAAGGWVGYSTLYSAYLNTVGGRAAYYGSLSVVMFSLLWLYFCMYIFFVGAEVNVWLHENCHRRRKR
ncbi:MAG: YihY/virulence factor BrkB family protein [Ruminococcaceae bacterium]|nr:YihY/virulence factor BrkB family protein [Oscillospiraceae bacterium]